MKYLSAILASVFGTFFSRIIQAKKIKTFQKKTKRIYHWQTDTIRNANIFKNRNKQTEVHNAHLRDKELCWSEIKKKKCIFSSGFQYLTLKLTLEFPLWNSGLRIWHCLCGGLGHW